MDEKGEFPKFKELLQNAMPSPYHEENAHIQDFLIGTSITVFGFWFMLLLAALSDEFEILGLFVTLGGIALILHGILKFFSLRKIYSFMGLSRKTISDAIMYLDARARLYERTESNDHGHGKMPFSDFELNQFRREFRELVIHTCGLISWPSRIADEISWDVQIAKYGLRSHTITSLGVMSIFIVLIAYLFTLSNWIWMVVGFLLGCSLLGSVYGYIRYLYNNRLMFRDNWISTLVTSESIQLDDVINQIFDILQAKFPYPLRFYLISEYPQLDYTGRTMTTETKIPLKEAILYPKDNAIKEESTGA
ncbi:MAG: hypothetical protein ACFFBJ_01265 [Promethearchaeota archaeon]